MLMTLAGFGLFWRFQAKFDLKRPCLEHLKVLLSRGTGNSAAKLGMFQGPQILWEGCRIIGV